MKNYGWLVKWLAAKWVIYLLLLLSYLADIQNRGFRYFSSREPTSDGKVIYDVIGMVYGSNVIISKDIVFYPGIVLWMNSLDVSTKWRR